MISRRRGADCVSDSRLDELFVGELPDELAAVVHAHLAACAACAERHAQLAADRADFAAQAPAFGALMQGERRQSPVRGSGARLLRFALPAAALLALGVGLGTLLRERGDSARAPADTGTRVKGSGAAFGFVVRRGERSFAGEPGQVLHSGDVLRFTLSSSAPQYAGVWGVDALGRASPYQGGQQLALLSAGQHVPLPEAVELDDSLGEELLVAVFCSRQLPASEITAALAASASSPRLPAGCASESLGIVKAPP